MAINYPRMQALAERLIRENGRSATLIAETTTGPDYDPTITQSSSALILVETPFTDEDRNDWLIQARDVRFLISSSFDPQPSMRISDNGQQYSIVARKVIKPGPVTCLYIVQGRV